MVGPCAVLGQPDAASCGALRDAMPRYAGTSNTTFVQLNVRSALPSLWLLCRAGCQALLLARCAGVGLFFSELRCALACAHHGAQQAGAWAFLQERVCKMYASGRIWRCVPLVRTTSYAARGARNSVEAWP